MKIEKGEDSAFILEAADCLMPFGGPVKFKKGVLPSQIASEFIQYVPVCR